MVSLPLWYYEKRVAWGSSDPIVTHRSKLRQFTRQFKNFHFLTQTQQTVLNETLRIFTDSTAQLRQNEFFENLTSDLNNLEKRGILSFRKYGE